MNHWLCRKDNNLTDAQNVGETACLPSGIKVLRHWQRGPLSALSFGIGISAQALFAHEVAGRYTVFGDILAHGIFANQLAHLLNEVFDQPGRAINISLRGEFAFVAFDRVTGHLFALRDHFGVRPLYYALHDGQWLFSSCPATVARVLNPSPMFDTRYLQQLLCTLTNDTDHTAFEGVKRLMPGHFLHTGKAGPQMTVRYWQPTRAVQLLKPNEHLEALKEFERLLNRAVALRVPTDGKAGAELSGGIDSSLIAALAVKQGRQLFTVSHGLSEGYKARYSFPLDEKHLIDQTLAHYPQIAHTWANGEGYEADASVRSYIQATGWLPQGRLQIFSDQLLQLAASKGVNIMLSGFGGDEGVTNHGQGVLWQWALEKQYGRLWSALRKVQFRDHGHPLRQFLSLVVKAMKSNKEQEVYKLPLRTIHEKIESICFTRDYIREMGLAEKIREYYRANDNNTYYERVIRSLNYPSIAGRLEATDAYARTFGITYRYPLLDVDLVEHFLTFPVDWQIVNGWNRYPVRSVASVYLPDDITWGQKRNGTQTQPNVRARVMSAEPVFRELLHRYRSHPSFSGVFDFDKITSEMEAYLTGQHPAMFLNYLSVLLLENEYPGSVSF